MYMQTQSLLFIWDLFVMKHWRVEVNIIACIFTDLLNLFFDTCVLFQSLDYDNIENQLFLEEERRMSHMVNTVGIAFANK